MRSLPIVFAGAFLLTACGSQVPVGPHPNFSGAVVANHYVDAHDRKVLHVVVRVANHGTLAGTPECETQASWSAWAANADVSGRSVLPGQSESIDIRLTFDVPIDTSASVVIDTALTHCNTKPE